MSLPSCSQLPVTMTSCEVTSGADKYHATSYVESKIVECKIHCPMEAESRVLIARDMDQGQLMGGFGQWMQRCSCRREQGLIFVA